MGYHSMLRILSEDDCGRILGTALAILERKGVRFTQQPAIQVFMEAGFSVSDELG